MIICGIKSYTRFDFSADDLYINSKLHNSNRELQTGDILIIEMGSIIEEVYDYISELGASSFQSGTPTNPTNNINNSILGYLSVFTSESIHILLKNYKYS